MDDDPVDLDAIPPSGGRWIRDPYTGALSPAPDQDAAPEAQQDQE